jgi:hypothetical protein
MVGAAGFCGSEFIRESSASVACIVKNTDVFADESAPIGQVRREIEA